MLKRRLNEIEFLIWTFGQPNNMSMSVTLNGTINIERLRTALDRLQEKHVMLQAQLITDENNIPFFIWDKQRDIQMEVIPRTKNNLYEKIVEKEFITPFEIGIDSHFPLIRVKLLFSEEKSDLIVTLQHVIGDGLSMGFIFRDILLFYINPERPFKPDEIMTSIENILPIDIQKKIPNTPRKFKLMMWVLKIILKFKRLKRKLLRKKLEFSIEDSDNIENSNFMTLSWILDKKHTTKFLKKCRKNNVTIHSAICTLFIEDFPSINNPVNLRDKLAYSVNDSVGLFAGGLVISKEYKEKYSFWENARNYYRKLVEGLNSEEVFKIFKIISRAVPLKDLEEFGSIFIEVASNDKPFAVTNLGSLDKLNLITTPSDLEVEDVFGGVSSSFNAIILTIYTIKKKMHFHLHYYNPPYSPEKMKNYANNAKHRLNTILKD